MSEQNDDQIARTMELSRKRRDDLAELQRRVEAELLRLMRGGRPLLDSRSGKPFLGADGKPMVGPPSPTDIRSAVNYLISCGVPKGRLDSATRHGIAEVLRRLQDAHREGDPFASDPRLPEIDQ